MTARPIRTCVGCGRRDASRSETRMIRLALAANGAVQVDLPRRQAGRGAYVHAQPRCVGRAARGLARAFGEELARPPRGSDLAEALAAGCDEAIAGLLVAARRIGAVVAGGPAVAAALSREPTGSATVAVAACDGAPLGWGSEIVAAASRGRVVVWGTTRGLGDLLGEQGCSVCAIGHPSIARRLLDAHAARSAVSAAMGMHGLGMHGRDEGHAEDG